MSGRGSVAVEPCLLKVGAALAERSFGEVVTVVEAEVRPKQVLAPAERIG